MDVKQNFVHLISYIYENRTALFTLSGIARPRVLAVNVNRLDACQPIHQVRYHIPQRTVPSEVIVELAIPMHDKDATLPVVIVNLRQIFPHEWKFTQPRDALDLSRRVPLAFVVVRIFTQRPVA